RQVQLAQAAPPMRDVADDGRVREIRQHRRLAPEALRLRRVRRHHHLERHLLIGVPIVRTVHGAHSPGAGKLQDLEAIADHRAALHRVSHYKDCLDLARFRMAQSKGKAKKPTKPRTPRKTKAAPAASRGLGPDETALADGGPLAPTLAAMGA